MYYQCARSSLGDETSLEPLPSGPGREGHPPAAERGIAAHVLDVQLNSVLVEELPELLDD
jgi:hypothetical protein